MDCSEEVAAIERALKPLPGVLGVRAEIVASKVTVFHDGKLSRSVIAEAINKSGVTVQDEKERGSRPSASTILVATSGIATGLGLLLQWFGFKDGWQPDAAFLAAIVTGGWLVIPKALRSLRSLSLDMNVLMTVAVLGAVAIGEHAEGAAVAFLFSLSELLESWSVGRARRAIEALMELTPDTALVKQDGEWREVAATEVQPGEIFLVKPGQKAPLDGEVVNGNSSMDQSPITGESIPVEKKPGDTVFAGTINAEGVLEVRATKAAATPRVARIIRMVEEAQQQRAPAQRFVDTFAKYYTPAVMVLAVILAIAPPLLFAQPWDTWIYRALVLLVIACPCALVISTPVSVVSGLTAMARAGVLIKGGAYLEALAGLRALAVDKTGTITEGKPRVQEVIPWNHTPANEILRIAASLDAQSSHPLAQAVVEYARGQGTALEAIDDFRSVTGRGAEGSISGHAYFVGNHRFAHELGVCSTELENKLAEIESSARSVVIVGHRPHGRLQGRSSRHSRGRGYHSERGGERQSSGFTPRESARSSCSAATTPARRRRLRSRPALMRRLAIFCPTKRSKKSANWQKTYGAVGMIGDGVNDAPALAAASVGIAMGAGGTDTAIETADVALIKDDLLMVAEAIRLGRRTLGMIRFNIAFSLAVKALFLVLAVLGMTSLWLAILADTGATLLVVMNALRLLRPTPHL